MTKGQRVLLWIVGISAILMGLPTLVNAQSYGLDVGEVFFILVTIGGGVFALFKVMSRGLPPTPKGVGDPTHARRPNVMRKGGETLMETLFLLPTYPQLRTALVKTVSEWANETLPDEVDLDRAFTTMMVAQASALIAVVRAGREDLPEFNLDGLRQRWQAAFDAALEQMALQH